MTSTIPAALAEPFDVFFTRLDELVKLTDVTRAGLIIVRVFAGERMDESEGVLSGAARRWRRIVFTSLQRVFPKDARSWMNETIEASSREQSIGFSNVFAQACVSAWHAVETLVDDVAEGWIKDPDRLAAAPALRKLSDEARRKYVHSIDPGRQRALLEKIKAKNRSRRPATPGVSRFQRLFDEIGIEVRPAHHDVKNLAELAAWRNVYVHRGGVVDQRFVEVCAPTSYKVGDRLRMTEPDYERFVNSCGLYVRAVERGVVEGSLDAAVE